MERSLVKPSCECDCSVCCPTSVPCDTSTSTSPSAPTSPITEAPCETPSPTSTPSFHSTATISTAPQSPSTPTATPCKTTTISSPTPTGESHTPTVDSPTPTVGSPTSTDASPTPPADSPAPTAESSTPNGSSATPADASSTPSGGASTPTPTEGSPTPSEGLSTPSGACPTSTDASPTPTVDSPTPSGGSSTPSGGLPKPTDALPPLETDSPTPTHASPTPTSDSPTPTGDSPSSTAGSSTPSGGSPAPTPTADSPTPSSGSSTPSGSSPTSTDASPPPTADSSTPTGGSPTPTGGSSTPSGATPTADSPSPSEGSSTPSGASPTPTDASPTPTSTGGSSTPSGGSSTPTPTADSPTPSPGSSTTSGASPTSTDASPTPTADSPTPSSGSPTPSGGSSTPSGATPTADSPTSSEGPSTPSGASPTPTDASPIPTTTGDSPPPTGGSSTADSTTPSEGTSTPTGATPTPTDASPTPTSDSPSPTPIEVSPTPTDGSTSSGLPTPTIPAPTGGTIDCDPTCCNTTEGYTHVLEGNCQKFVVCVGGKENIFTCSNNLQYNSATGQCDYPNNVNCTWPQAPPSGPSAGPSGTYCETGGRCVGQPDGTSFASETDACSSDYIVCQCECEVKRSCSSQLMFNVKLGVYPSSVTKYNCENGTRFNPSLLICIEDPCDSSVCANATNDGVAYPANNYPQGFCICVNGVAEVHACPSGAVFDPTTAICISSTTLQCNISKCANATSENTYPVAANNDSHGFCYCFSATEIEFFSCPDDALFDPDLGICDVNGAVTSTPGPEGNCTCPGGYKEGQLVSNPTNCRLYYVCSSGRLEEHDCGAGNLFDQVSLSCQPVDKKRTLTIGHLMRSEVLPEDDKLCMDNEKQSVPSNCSQYEICIDGAWTRLSCSSERYYNPEQRKCMEPRDDTVCAYARVKNLPICSASMEQRTVPVKEPNCGQYYRCNHGKWRLKTCPKHYFYSKRLKTCIPSPHDDACVARNATGIDDDMEPNSNMTSSKCRHMEVRRYEQNCAMYLMCMEGKWWHQYCPLGMYYNHTYNYCMPNINGQCATSFDTSIQDKPSMQPCDHKGAVRPSALSCDRYFECQAGYWELRNCGPHQYFNATERACLSDKEGFCAQFHKAQCDEGEKRDFPLNCAAYEICMRGTWIRASCNHSWIFDNTLRMCIPNDGSCAENGLRKVCGVGETKAHPLPENCTQFYYCLKDSWYEGTCLKGHTFIKLTRECAPHDVYDKCQPLSVEGSENITTSAYLNGQKQIGSNRSALCLGRADGSAVPHPYSCLHFFICISELAENEQKCVRGSFFDDRLGYCRPNDGNCVVPLSGVCASATDGGYVADPEDCQAYYHCSTLNGTERLKCAEGEYYHNVTSQCQIDRGECRFRSEELRKCVGAEHGKRLPHERYCNLYYACVRGLAIPVACPAGQQFSAALGSCVLDEMHQCENGTLAEASKNVTTNHICVNLADGIHLPNTADCTKYYVCLGGVPLTKNCPKDAFFDLKQELCVPDDGSCPYVENSQSNHQPEPPQPADCEGKHGSMISDPANCNEFYVCINGKLRHERCFTNFYFNASLRQCQPYEQDIENTTNADAASSNASQMKVMLNALHCSNKPTNYTQLCTQIPQGTSIAEQDDCRRYINCNDAGEPVSQRCRNGESYDSLLGFCRQNDGTCLLENGQRVGECNGRHGQLVRDADSCRSYFVCINGQKIAKKCEEKEYFDKMLSTCAEDVNNQCGTVAEQSIEWQVMSCSGLSDTSLYPYTGDNCRSYFQCANGKPTVHECADGLYFNASIGRCVKDITECALPAVTVKRTPEVVSFEENICEKAVPGQRYANIGDLCRSFYVCLEDGTVAYTTCPLDELYNSESGTCEVARDVICKI
ncbi:uncharacterized protein LOC118740146 [Rhagoletis pomonella]|uniref:uncharacterized protein LOC118740146 n=1 Tax=Rhagoletis pomonella TaxID=28610 RepID=UPI00177F552B|nr:uncharacterized protein LOC118740146 [Rhagoletis pomonella]